MPERRAPTRAAARALVALLLPLTATACSDGTPAAPTTTADPSRRITEAEAVVLAELLQHDLAAGGAAVHATVPFGSSSFDLTGEIDWRGGVGRLHVHPTVDGRAGRSFDVVFDPTVVLEEVPGLADRLAARGAAPAGWVARPLDASRSPLDVVIGLVQTAASTTRDNPVLLQSRDVRRLRSDRVDGVAADVFRDGRTTYWVRHADPILVRLDAELESTSSTARITFSDWGPRTVATPADAEIVALDAVRDLYDELRRDG